MGVFHVFIIVLMVLNRATHQKFQLLLGINWEEPKNGLLDVSAISAPVHQLGLTSLCIRRKYPGFLQASKMESFAKIVHG